MYIILIYICFTLELQLYVQSFIEEKAGVYIGVKAFL